MGAITACGPTSLRGERRGHILNNELKADRLAAQNNSLFKM